MARPLSLKQQKFVSAYLGVANGNGTQAARLAGYAGDDLQLGVISAQNLVKPSIASAIEAGRAAIRAEGIAFKQNRIDAQNRRWQAMVRVIDERAAFHDGDAPGAGTGLLVRSYKGLGSGDALRIYEEWAVDTGLLAELRQLEQHTAKELGQWSDKAEIAHTVDITSLTDEQLADLAAGRPFTPSTRGRRIGTEAAGEAPPE